jgi:hypothetical protein
MDFAPGPFYPWSLGSQTKAWASLLAGVLLVVLIFVWASPDHGFDKQRDAAMDQAFQLLISRNYCSSLQDCSKHEFMFCAPKTGGYEISLYGLDNPVLNDVAQIFVKQFGETPSMQFLHV